MLSPTGDNVLDPVDERVGERLAAIDLTGALEEIWTLVRAANRFVEERKPWELAKQDDEASARRLDETLYTLADTVRGLGVLLHPYIPSAAEAMLEAVGDPGAVGWERAPLGQLAAGVRVKRPEPIFPRLATA